MRRKKKSDLERFSFVREVLIHTKNVRLKEKNSGLRRIWLREVPAKEGFTVKLPVTTVFTAKFERYRSEIEAAKRRSDCDKILKGARDRKVV